MKLIPTKEDFMKLNILELDRYAGEESRFESFDGLRLSLLDSPIQINSKEGHRVASNDFYQICKRIEGRYGSMILARQILDEELMARTGGDIVPGYRILTLLFDGIYVGEPEDLRNHKLGNGKEMLYPVGGIGEIIAEVKFFE